MAEAAMPAPASAASAVLENQTPTPIAQLNPELPDRETRVIAGVVTITWPYSIVTRSAAFILAEHDFRLRHAHGQLRIEFHGNLGQKLADAGIGGGDGLRISLEGAEWEEHKSQTRVPGTILEWQLKFTKRLLMRVQRADDQRTETLDLNLADDANGDDAPLATLTPQESSPLNHSGLFATEVVSTPRALSTKRRASYAFEPAEYASPAFLKRARVSYGSLFEDGFDIFDEDVAKRNKKKAKRTRFSMGATGWKYSSRSPSPELQSSKTHELDSDSEEGIEVAKPIESAAQSIQSPTMVDESSQTQETSFASQIAEQTREYALLIPSSPTLMTFGKPEEQSNGHATAPAFDAPSTVEDGVVSPFPQLTRPLFDGITNISAPATTSTPSQSAIFGSSFGNSGFSVEHTTMASTSSIPVFNDALAESIQSRQAAEERVPGQPEPAFDVTADEAYSRIATGFDVVDGHQVPQETDFTTTEFSLPSNIRNPFAVEPFPRATLSAPEQVEEDIYEANAYPEIQDEEDHPEKLNTHVFDFSRHLDQMASDVTSQAAREEERVEGRVESQIKDSVEAQDGKQGEYQGEDRDEERNQERGEERDEERDEEQDGEQDEGTDYEIDAGETPWRRQQVDFEERQDEDEDEEEEEDEDEEGYDEDAEGYDDEDSGPNEHYEEDEEERYDDEDEEEQEYSDDEGDEPAAQAEPASQTPVYIDLLSDSEDEAEPAAQTPAPAITKAASSEPKQREETDNPPEYDIQDDDDVRQQLPRESKALQSDLRQEEMESNAENEGANDASSDEQKDEIGIVKRTQREDPVADKCEVSPAKHVESVEEQQEPADEMDVDDDRDEVVLIRMTEPDRQLNDRISRVPSPAADEQPKDADAMEEDVKSDSVQIEKNVNGKTKDADEDGDVEVRDVPEQVGDESGSQPDVNMDVKNLDEVEDEIKSQPDVNMDIKEPEDVEYELQSQPDVDMHAKEPEEVVTSLENSVEIVPGEMPTKQSERETEDQSIPEAPERPTKVTEDVAEVDDEQMGDPKASAQDELSEEYNDKQPVVEAETTAHTASTSTTRSTEKNQLLTPIDTQLPVIEAADIEIVQTTPNRPRQDAEEVDEDDLAASQQIMGEFLQHISPKQDLSSKQEPRPPPLPIPTKEHRRKRSDTVSETGRRTRSQAKQHPGEETEAEGGKTSPLSHRHSSRPIDKNNDATVVASIEPTTSISSNRSSDRTPLLQRSFRITRSRGTAERADPSVAIARVGRAASSASPKSGEHTPSRPITLRVTRSMENIAEAGLRDGLVIPDASVRSVRLDDASSAGTRSPAHSTPLTPNTQMQVQLHQEQRYSARRPSESPTIVRIRGAPSIAVSPPPPGDHDDAPTTTASELKLQLQRDLRTTLPDNLPLRHLRTSLHKTADVIAVAAATPAPPNRPRNGPRDYMLELLLVDPSSAPSGVHVAHIFRPHQHSLPVVRCGDVVLLRAMAVVAVKGRGFGLRAGDASAWAVFDEEARTAVDDGSAVLPQIQGPPLDVMEAEVQYAMGLSRWWALLDEPTMSKLERATQKMLPSS
ncbi:hypothetical protein MY11210_007070 [Beauveria gryllotalpidicola]